MIFLKKIKHKALIPLVILMLTTGCTQKSIILSIPDNLAERVAEANRLVCDYKGRISVIYENGEEDVRFKGLLNKDCADNFQLKILGLFNTVAYDVSYQNGVVEAYEKGEDVSLEIAYFMQSKGLDKMISLIRYPHVKIDDSFKVRAVADEYILTKSVFKVAAGQDYLIKRIMYPGGQFSYGYEEGKLSELVFEEDGTRVEIRLR